MSAPERLGAERIAELRAVAEAATPEEWELYGCGCVLSENDTVYFGEPGDPKGAHIAAFDPPTVLALLDQAAEVERLAGEVARLRDLLPAVPCTCLWSGGMSSSGAWTKRMHQCARCAALNPPEPHAGGDPA